MRRFGFQLMIYIVVFAVTLGIMVYVPGALDFYVKNMDLVPFLVIGLAVAWLAWNTIRQRATERAKQRGH